MIDASTVFSYLPTVGDGCVTKPDLSGSRTQIDRPRTRSRPRRRPTHPQNLESVVLSRRETQFRLTKALISEEQSSIHGRLDKEFLTMCNNQNNEHCLVSLCKFPHVRALLNRKVI